MVAISTHASPARPQVHLPRTWEQAADVLDACGPDASVAGGATYLMWQAAHGRPLPRHLISLHRIPGHAEVQAGSVGALASLRQVEQRAMSGAARALQMAASVAAGPSVRSVATVGGNLASGFAHADLVPALMALDARVHLHDDTSLPVEQLIEQLVDTRPDDLLMTRVTYNPGSAGDGWTGASVKLSRRGMDLSIALTAVALRVVDQRVAEARIAVGSLCDQAVRLKEVEASLLGTEASAEAVTAIVCDEHLQHLPFRDDGETTAAYRRRVAAPVVRRAVNVALRLGPHSTPQAGDARI